MTMKIFDTHAHYDDRRFNDTIEEVLTRNNQGGVEGIINCSVNYESAAACQSLADRFSFCYTAVGVHPGDIPQKEVDVAPLFSLAKHSKTIAIGEIGLDYHYEDSWDRETQIAWFEAQLIAANQLGLPVIVHDRDAHADTMELLKKHRPKGVVHCFSGSSEMAKEIISLGMYIGLGGVVTFKNARKAVEVAMNIPLDRLLLETDAPYMAPVPHRGETCESLYISHTAERIAELRGISRDEVLKQSRENTRTLFGI